MFMEWILRSLSISPPHSKLTNQLHGAESYLRRSHPANNSIPRLLWNPKVHYRVHKSPLLAPILSQTNAIHTIPTYFSKIHSNIILSSTPTLSDQHFVYTFSFPHISEQKGNIIYYLKTPKHFQGKNIFQFTLCWNPSETKIILPRKG
jgi:hypothetical protein